MLLHNHFQAIYLYELDYEITQKHNYIKTNNRFDPISFFYKIILFHNFLDKSMLGSNNLIYPTFHRYLMYIHK